jgi:uncharacterized membrane protein YkvA (DUF1232 family)
MRARPGLRATSTDVRAGLPFGKAVPSTALVFVDPEPALRLIRAYAKGDYRAIPWESLLLIVAAIIYFVSPVDAIPDFLPVRLVDDAVVIAFVVGVVAEELDDFMEWEKAQVA